MRTTLALDDEVYQLAKSLAENSNRTLGEVISELVRRGLEPRSPTIVDDLPVFDVPREAEIIPGNRAAVLLADEGID